ncbi:MAG: hypothetical protein Q9160_006743 [Pyrenula sp. 1 TL-2023]
MRRRTTFVHDPAAPVNPSDLKASSHELRIDGLPAAREERLTFAFQELPQEKTFTAPHVLSTRFANTPSLQYHSLLPSLEHFVSYIQKHACPHSSISCLDAAGALYRADTLDLDFDSISHTLTLAAYWSHAPDPKAGWSETISSARDGESAPVEVGILSLEKSGEPHDLTLSGHLITLDASAHVSPTFFSFPSRHHPLPSSQIFSTSFLHPTGLHPTLQLTFPNPLSTPSSPSTDNPSSCALHTYLTLPSSLFPDIYQLSAANSSPPSPFTIHHNISRLLTITPSAPPPDLEAPVWAHSPWGSSVLLELRIPPSSSPTPFQATIPLHLRYQEPVAGGKRTLRVPDPIVFWACPAEEGTKFNVNPFDRVGLGWDGVFGPRTAFWQMKNVGRGRNNDEGGGRALVRDIEVPVLDLDGWVARWVQLGTVLVVLGGWAWLMWLLGRLVLGDWKKRKAEEMGERKGKGPEEKKRQ